MQNQKSDRSNNPRNKIGYNAHYSCCKQKPEKYSRNCFLHFHLKQTGKQCAGPCSGSRQRYSYKQKQTPEFVFSHLIPFCKSFLFKPRYKSAEPFSGFKPGKDLIDKKKYKRYRYNITYYTYGYSLNYRNVKKRRSNKTSP